jgi:signal transduction histidine kinase
VSFLDDGPGIPPDTLASIFDPFYTTKRPGRGTGLGLSICKSVMKEHGGTIEAANAPGGGAVFTVTLPAVAPLSQPNF